jgi:hypothetical protein
MKEDECSICLEEKQDDITVLLCKHKFHKNCINDWLKIKQICCVSQANTSFASKLQRRSEYHCYLGV